MDWGGVFDWEWKDLERNGLIFILELVLICFLVFIDVYIRNGFIFLDCFSVWYVLYWNCVMSLYIEIVI